MTRRPTPTELDNAAAWAAYASRTSQQAEAAVRVLLAVVVAVLLALALVHWATPCADATLCLSPLALPLPPRLRLWWLRQCRRLHIALLQARLTQLLGTAQQMALDDKPALQLAGVLIKAAAVRLALTRAEQLHRADAWLARRADWRPGDLPAAPPARHHNHARRRA